MYLLDTHVLSEAAKPVSSNQVIAWLEQTDEDRLLLSAVSIAEIKRGIARLSNGKK